jgi:hypothetical protein
MEPTLASENVPQDRRTEDSTMTANSDQMSDRVTADPGIVKANSATNGQRNSTETLSDGDACISTDTLSNSDGRQVKQTLSDEDAAGKNLADGDASCEAMETLSVDGAGTASEALSNGGAGTKQTLSKREQKRALKRKVGRIGLV